MTASSTKMASYEKAVEALLSELSLRAAAARLGVDEGTLHRWLKDPVLAEMYREARTQLLQQAIARLCHAADGAVDTLQHVALDGDQPAASRVSAARTILELTYRGVEQEQISDRLKRIEDAQGKHKPKWDAPYPTPIPARDNTVGEGGA